MAVKIIAAGLRSLFPVLGWPSTPGTARLTFALRSRPCLAGSAVGRF